MGDSDSDYDTEEYNDMDEYLSTDTLAKIFTAVPSKSRPNCYSFRMRGLARELAPKFSSIWAAARKGSIGRTDLGAIEEAQIKLIKERINKNIKKKLHRAEAEEKAFACLEKDIGRSPVHRRRSTFGGGKSTRKKRKKRKTRRKKRKRRKKRTKRRGKKRARRR